MAEEETQPGVETDKAVAADSAPITEAATATAVTQAAAPVPPAPERRIAQRYIAHWRAALVSVSDGGVRYLGTTDNICASGAAIACEDHVPPQKEYHIYLEIPQATGKTPLVIQLQGKVMHTTLSRKVFKIGVVFKQFHGDAEKVLHAILAGGKLKPLSSGEN